MDEKRKRSLDGMAVMRALEALETHHEKQRHGV
jgi:hypothetical protein